MRHLRCLAATLAGIVLGVWTASPAEASPYLRLENGAFIVEIVDNGAGDLDPTPGSILFSGVVGAFTTNITTGLSRPVIGDPFRAAIDLNSIDATFSGAGSSVLSITFADTGFAFSSLAGSVFAPSSSIGGVVGAGGTLTTQSYIDLTDASPLPAGGGPVVIPGTSALIYSGAFGPGAFSGAGGISLLNPGSPFSLFTRVQITLPGAGTSTSFNDLTDVAVPEPISLSLVGLGLAGGALHRRRKFRT